MGNTRECMETLRHYATARIPFVVFDTIEAARGLEIIKKVTEDLVMHGTYVHSVNKGMYDILTGSVVNEDVTLYGAMTYIAEQMRRKQELTFVLTGVSGLDDDNADTRQLLSIMDIAVETGGMVIVITTGSIWSQLQRTGMRVKLDFPDEMEMRMIISDMLNDYRGSFRIDWDEEDIKEAASMLAGVSKFEAENVIADLLANRRIEKKDLAKLRFVKDRLFSDISGLERITTVERDGEVGGLAGLRAWLDEKKKLQTPAMREKMQALGLPAPRGILLVGVPGCGKSISAKAIAVNWNLPLYRLDFATVQGSYVGQSEQQLREALETAEQVSPCVLWVDEIEKGLSGAAGGGDGGVSTRMVGQFLFWLQECRKFVFVVATANDVSKLPSELLRRGRFDELFFVDLPTLQERKSILALHYRHYIGHEISPQLLDKLADMSEGFTGADLESAMRDAGYYQLTHDGREMPDESIIAMVGNIIPLSRTSPEKIEAIRAWGRERAVPASGRPIGGAGEDAKFGRRILVHEADTQE